AFSLLSFPDISFSQLVDVVPELAAIDIKDGEQLEKDALYAHYIDRQAQDVTALKRDENWIIPDGFDYSILPGLSNELKLKLGKARPLSLGQAGRVDGMTPAALTLILARLRQDKRVAVA
ncbi:MAG TPA: tRNA uridine-5-carboxymethylaminomethyl(34) synthesis enzyme MnmG, partial [Paenirhodobacter sp.]